MDLLASQFEAHREHLRSVAYRMLGSRAEADDAVQDAWLRLSQSDASAVQNLQSWLTTVVARVCLDVLRSRASRKVSHDDAPRAAESADTPTMLADSLAPALVVVLDALAPVERLTFVLHDVFAVSFEEIAPIIGKTPAAARQIASRARRRVQGKPEPLSADAERRRDLVAAFLAASRGGDFTALLELLDPQAVVRADATAQGFGARERLDGAESVAKFLLPRAQGARAFLVDGEPNAAWVVDGAVRVAFFLAIAPSGRITAIDLVGDARRLAQMDLEQTER